MPGRIFKLRTPTLAIRANENSRTLTTIPANAMVALVMGDVDSDGLVQIRFKDEALLMFAQDVRTRAERVAEQSA
jgi:hypothetical protein